jgi:hypothetical protein
MWYWVDFFWQKLGAWRARIRQAPATLQLRKSTRNRPKPERELERDRESTLIIPILWIPTASLRN